MDSPASPMPGSRAAGARRAARVAPADRRPRRRRGGRASCCLGWRAPPRRAEQDRARDGRRRGKPDREQTSAAGVPRRAAGSADRGPIRRENSGARAATCSGRARCARPARRGRSAARLRLRPPRRGRGSSHPSPRRRPGTSCPPRESPGDACLPRRGARRNRPRCRSGAGPPRRSRCGPRPRTGCAADRGWIARSPPAVPAAQGPSPHRSSPARMHSGRARRNRAAKI